MKNKKKLNKVKKMRVPRGKVGGFGRPGAGYYNDLADRLVRKWEPTGLLEGLPVYDKGNLSFLLENEARHLINETTYNAGDEGYETVLFSMVRKVFAKLISEEILSVQAMPLRTSLIFYLNAKYGSDHTALGITSGDDILGADTPLYNFKSGFSRAYQTQDNVSISGTLNWVNSGATGAYSGSKTGFQTATPSNSSHYVARAAIDVSGLTYTPDYKAVRNWKFQEGTSGTTEVTEFFDAKYAEIDETNKVVYPLVAVSTTGSIGNDEYVKITYVAKADTDNPAPFEYQGTDLSIPEVDIDIESKSVTADEYKLKARWTPEIAQDLSTYHNVDAQTELVNVMSSLVAAEIDQLNIDMLFQSAWNEGTKRYWTDKIGTRYDNDGNASTSGGTFYGTQKDWNQELLTKLMNLSSVLGKKLVFGDGNFVVVGPTAGTLLDTLDAYTAIEQIEGTASQYVMGPREVGTVKGKIRVFRHPYFPENFVLMGHKGVDVFDTVAVYAPYIPLVFTPVIYDPDNLIPIKGLITRAAKEVVRSDGLGILAIEWVNLI